MILTLWTNFIPVLFSALIDPTISKKSNMRKLLHIMVIWNGVFLTCIHSL